MKDYANGFYKSQAWKTTRAAYLSYAKGLCEVCLARGVYSPGEIVHHKVHLTPDNINDPTISLNFDNLQLVCRKCHADLHDARKRRYRIDETGRVIV